jgi:hypothetical protein
VPAERIHARGGFAAGLAERVRREGIVQAIGISRITAQARYPDECVNPVVIRRQVGIGDRPVVGNSVKSPDPEI